MGRVSDRFRAGWVEGGIERGFVGQRAVMGGGCDV